MPIWTVAMNRSGSARSAATVCAPRRFSSTSWASRVRRIDTIAISAPANTPFAIVSASMTTSSVRMRGSCWGHPQQELKTPVETRLGS